jgi:hypothetical protein
MVDNRFPSPEDSVRFAAGLLLQTAEGYVSIASQEANVHEGTPPKPGVTPAERDNGGVRRVAAVPCKDAHQSSTLCTSTMPMSVRRRPRWYRGRPGATPGVGSIATSSGEQRALVALACADRHRGVALKKDLRV